MSDPLSTKKDVLSTTNYKVEYADEPGFLVNPEAPEESAWVYAPYRVTNTRTGLVEGYAAKMFEAFQFVGNAENVIKQVTETFCANIVRGRFPPGKVS